VKKCIASWRRCLPDYEIKEWNELNFDVNSNDYVREAYESGKFAFVSDYVRLYALATEGGVYMDTDVEVLKSYDSFLHHHAFSGFEENRVASATIGSEKGGKWITALLNGYRDRKLVGADGSFDMTPNTHVITRYMLDHGLVCDNTFQDFPGLVAIYPSDYFSPRDLGTGRVCLSPRSVCIHHFAGSWLPTNVKWIHRAKLALCKVFGPRLITPIAKYILKKKII